MDKLLNIIQRNVKLRLRCQKKKNDRVAFILRLWLCAKYPDLILKEGSYYTFVFILALRDKYKKCQSVFLCHRASSRNLTVSSQNIDFL